MKIVGTVRITLIGNITPVPIFSIRILVPVILKLPKRLTITKLKLNPRLRFSAGQFAANIPFMRGIKLA